jgi:hypothetical protein
LVQIVFEVAAVKERRLPIMPTLAAVYRDWRRLLFPLRTITISALLIVLAISAVTELVPHRLWDRELSDAALGLAEDAVRALLLTPIVIAIHRFVVLGEVTPGYGLDVGEPAFWHFFAWLFALKVIAGLPYELLGLLQAHGYSLWATALVLAIALIIAIAVSLRLSVLFPAIAVEAPGATAPNAIADTRGQALRLLAIFFLALLPWFAAVMGVVILLGPGVGTTGSVPAIVALVVGGIAQTAVVSLSAVIASHAFIFLAAHVKRAAHQSPEFVEQKVR